MPKRRQKKLEVEVKAKKKFSQTSEDLEKEKILLMRVGVACVMVVFFIAWIFSLKYQFKVNSNNNDKSAFNWEQTKDELDQAMGQIKQGIAEIKQTQEIKQQNTLPREPELTGEQINLLKIKLLNEVATSTIASSTKK
ncbi:MAG: hypothetical protein WCL13_00250 [bacterium]